MKRSGVQKSQIFKRFFFSYIFVLVLPLIFGQIVYMQAFHIITNDSMESRFGMMDQSKMVLDNYLINTEKTVISLCLNNTLQSLTYLDRPKAGSPNIMRFLQAQKELKSYKFADTFDADYYITLRNSDAVFTRNSIYFGIEDFFSKYTVIDGYDYERVNKELLSNYSERNAFREVTIKKNSYDNNSTGRYIVFSQSLPLGYRNHIQGSILVAIQTDEIKKLLLGIDTSGEGWTYLADSSGSILFSSGGQEIPNIKIEPKDFRGSFETTIQGEGAIVLYERSSFKNWIYVTVLPTGIIMEKVNHVRDLMLATTIITIILGIMLSLFIANRNTRPFKNILRLLRDSDKGAPSTNNENEFITNSVMSLIDNNEAMKSAVENQSLFMQTSFFGRLLRGDFSDESELYALANYIGINLNFERFAVVLISVAQTVETSRNLLVVQDIKRVIIEDVLSRNMNETGYTHIIDSGSIALVLCQNASNEENNRQNINKLIQAVRNDLSRQYDIQAFFAIGNQYIKIKDMNYSFSEAKIAMESIWDSGVMGVVWFSDISKEKVIYYYPVEMEQQLIHLAKSGNKKDISRILDLIYSENILNRKLANYMIQNLFANMRSTIMKILGDSYLNPEVSHLRNTDFRHSTTEESFDLFRNVYAGICNRMENHKKSHNSIMITNILDYIQENYTNADLNAVTISERFQISESYFSQYFKEQTGETFSNYLRKIRIDTACEIIKEEKETIEEIARKVGYNNPYSLRRAFKTVTGVVPSEYKG